MGLSAFWQHPLTECRAQEATRTLSPLPCALWVLAPMTLITRLGASSDQLQLEAILCFRTCPQLPNEAENLFCEIGCMPHLQGIQVVNIAFGVRLDS